MKESLPAPPLQAAPLQHDRVKVTEIINEVKMELVQVVLGLSRKHGIELRSVNETVSKSDSELIRQYFGLSRKWQKNQKSPPAGYKTGMLIARGYEMPLADWGIGG